MRTMAASSASSDSMVARMLVEAPLPLALSSSAALATPSTVTSAVASDEGSALASAVATSSRTLAGSCVILLTCLTMAA